ncbi:futalosine hydrolase [Catellatospora methionotrophica]|uniref:futalosine hydrolase n=1 Tax=Catellatospora methionotrophica TaxID=121620 RepID=UPI0034014DD6
MTLLVVTAVAAEAEALSRGLPPGADVTVAPVGVGPAAAAAGTARLLALAGDRYRAVVSAGIGGGIGLATGATALATRCIAADLGADSPQGFLSLDELGFGSATAEVDAALLAALRAALPGAAAGEILTVSTVTGTAEGTAELLRRHPTAVAEAMEGYGVACAAQGAGLPFAELRTISNAVGPRDRAAWRIGDAFAALTAAGPALAALHP